LKNAQPTTHAIANKGFNGLRSLSPASSFVSVDRLVAPQSFTGHSVNVTAHFKINNPI